MLPAPGQGALAIECRSDDTDLLGRLGRLDDPATRAAVTAERAVLATLEAGCSAPLGALAEVVEGEDGDELWIRAVALSPDGGLSVRMSTTGAVDDAAGTGTRLASEMLADGAAGLMDSTGMEAPVRKQHDASTERRRPQPATTAPQGWVSFVGSGPGDPGLMTVRAVELLREAEVIVTESPEHVDLVRWPVDLAPRTVRCSSTAASARTASR